MQSLGFSHFMSQKGFGTHCGLVALPLAFRLGTDRKAGCILRLVAFRLAHWPATFCLASSTFFARAEVLWADHVTVLRPAVHMAIFRVDFLAARGAQRRCTFGGTDLVALLILTFPRALRHATFGATSLTHLRRTFLLLLGTPRLPIAAATEVASACALSAGLLILNTFFCRGPPHPQHLLILLILITVTVTVTVLMTVILILILKPRSPLGASIILILESKAASLKQAGGDEEETCNSYISVHLHCERYTQRYWRQGR